ncbi:hypothetical protein P4T70_23285 [Bacillus mobilis]|uniref:hypothetical protein n=1 Tax=Bacillus mobilis TaxID=2026190 RepID=UPI002E22613E|nr:hypothetical protein [Bacillus mobilis]
MKKYTSIISVITMLTAMVSSPQVVQASSYGDIEYYNQRKILEMNFDKEKIENTVTGKVYKTNEGKENFEPGSRNKGLKPNGDKVEIPLSDLDIKKQDELTFSFWMKWDGKKDMFMPIGFEEYSLYFIEGSFGFNTNNDDVFGVQDKIKPNELTHVVAVFNRNDVNKNKLYLNGVKQNLSQVRGKQFSEKVGWNNKLVISGYSYDNQYGLDGESILDEINIFNGGTDDKEIKDLYLMSRIPELSVSQNGLHARADWATEILDSDVLWTVGYEENEKPKPELVYDGNNGLGDGGQKIVHEKENVYAGTGAYMTPNTFPDKGNSVWWPYDMTSSWNHTWLYNPLALPNGKPVSASVKVKTDDEGTVSLFTSWAYRNSFTYRNIYFAEDVPPGTKTFKVNTTVGLGLASYITSDTDPYDHKENLSVREIDRDTNTVTLNAPIKGSFKKGEQWRSRNTGEAIRFATKTVKHSDGWQIINMNSKVTEYPDIDWLKNPRQLRQQVESKNGNTYVDDIKVGYATKVQLQRDGSKIYEGYGSEFEDMNAIDKEKPNKVMKATVVKEDKNLNVKFDKPKDRGTNYKYKIKGISENGETPFSTEKSVEVISGIKGYSYVLDKNPKTEPGNTINTTDENISFRNIKDEKQFLHIKAIDNQGNVSETAHIPIEIPMLEAKANHKENMVQLTWEGGKSEPYTYKVFKKKDGENEFQSVSATDYKKKVKVLNIYPTKWKDTTLSTIDFIDRDGKRNVMPVSASLKKWMEESNSENSKGYGMGVIEVDAVTQEEFNSSPNSYIYDEKGKDKYDVMMIGTYDANGWSPLGKESIQAIKDFERRGKGVLAGHDVMTKISSSVDFFDAVKDDFNVSDPTKFRGIGSEKIAITKKGLLLEYPWKIGNVGTELKIPMAHTMNIHFNGDTWMKFVGNSWGNPITGSAVDDSLNSNTNAYLHTWNNTAIIQTGHSNGQATPDEQKVLANTLFYLAQLTSDTHLDDRSGQDVDAPSKPDINKVTLNLDDTATINFKESVDKGTTYEYYVESKGSDTKSQLTSNVVKTEVKTGLRGYSIVIDEKPNTIPDEKIKTTSTSYQLDVPNKKEFYIHVASVDNAGNVSEVAHSHYEDKFSPEISITPSTKEWTNKEVTLQVVATDKDSRVIKICLPNGDWINNDKATFIVKENGIYYFKAVDEGGNETVQSIIVSNIDKENPSVDIEAPSTWQNKDIQVKIIGKD